MSGTKELDPVSASTKDGYIVEMRPVTVAEISETTRGRPTLVERRLGLAEELGFKGLTTFTGSNPEAAIQWCRAQGLRPISEADYALWRAYLPTPYWSQPDSRLNAAQEDLYYAVGTLGDRSHRGRSFEDYKFHEGVPLSVLERMKATKGLFVSEIRTPETNDSERRTRPDPVWFGHVVWPDGKRDIYQLARWGRDSDANFLPDMAAVKAIVDARRFGTRSMYGIAHTLWALLGLGALACGIAVDHWILFPLLAAILGFYVIALPAVSGIGMNLARKLGKSRLAKTNKDLVPLF